MKTLFEYLFEEVQSQSELVIVEGRKRVLDELK